MSGYGGVATQDWRKGGGGRQDYTLQGLDQDWINVTLPHLRPVKIDEHDYPGLLRGDGGAGFDVLDARGTFDKQEVRRELKRLSSDELENRLGVSFMKVDDILKRVPLEKDGRVSYKKFLGEVKKYRMSTEQEGRIKNIVRIFAFTEEFSCSPPTLFMIFISLVELGLFIYTSLRIPDDYGTSISWTGPVPYCSLLIYNPTRRWEIWRYFTYMFVHIGIQHFVFNMIMQIVVGISLEMSQPGILGSCRVMVVYLCGVVAASLGTSLSDPENYIAGASGGVYSLISAHLATLAINWQEDSSVRIQKVVHKPITRVIRLCFLTLLTLHDVGFAVYVRFYDPDNRTGFTGHLCGAIAGLLVGVFVLENRRVRSWEPVIQIVSCVLFFGMIAFAIVWNIMADTWFPGFFPEPDIDLYESYGKCKDYTIF